MTICLICQSPTTFNHCRRFPRYALCEQCEAAGYHLALGPGLEHCIRIPALPPAHSVLATCRQVRRLLRQGEPPAWLGPRARSSQTPTPTKKEKNHAP